MLNAYPDSIGEKLSDTVAMLRRPEFQNAFSLFYVLPTFFHSDMDGGFSIVDYGLNEELVSPEDLKALDELGIQIKLDLVVNHLSAQSPQFVDLMQRGEESEYRDFFIDWDEFWKDHGSVGDKGYVMPDVHYLEILFMRKPEMPVMRVYFPCGQIRTYWNTFYKKVDHERLTVEDIASVEGIDPARAAEIFRRIGELLELHGLLTREDMDAFADGDENVRQALTEAVSSKIIYLGQMDLNAKSEKVWEFYDDTLRKFCEYGAKIIRLDAFGYLHKEPGLPNFFNRPGTWDYLGRLRTMAEKHNLTVFPEVHAQYGAGTHEEVAAHGYPIYDFFFPGLVLDALERADHTSLLGWIREIRRKGLQTINMLGCHDGIPMMDLRGKSVDGAYHAGLLPDQYIDASVDRILERGGLTKNLYNAEGKKIDYYQVNATFFSALGEDEQKLLLARAIQMFMPGLPQVWYLDLFAGTNDYEAAHAGGGDSHKAINRTRLSNDRIEAGLQEPIVRNQLELIRLRNTAQAFQGQVTIVDTEPDRLHLAWWDSDNGLELRANLRDHSFTIVEHNGGSENTLYSFARES